VFRLRSRLYRHADFRRLWAGQTISQFGSQVTTLALPLVAVVALHASAFRVSLLAASGIVPYLLFALPAGAWVDRVARRPVLIGADVARALALGSIPIAAALAHVTFVQLVVAGFVAGTMTVFFDVAYQSYLPSLVEHGDLVDANSKLEISRSGAQIGGPGIAGLLIQWLGAPYAVAVDAVSFAWSAVFLQRIRTQETPERPAETPSLRREIGEGLRYLLRDARWRATTKYSATANLASGITGPLILVYAVRRWGLSPGQLGLTFTLGNIGWLVGALVAGRTARVLGLGRALVLGGALAGAPFLLVPVLPKAYAIPGLAAVQAIWQVGLLIYNVNALSLYQTQVPARLLGRVSASRRWIVFGVISLGNLLGGILAAQIGLRAALIVGGSISLVAFTSLLSPAVRTLATVYGDVRASAEERVALPAD
jgi:MFS family permease